MYWKERFLFVDCSNRIVAAHAVELLFLFDAAPVGVTKVYRYGWTGLALKV
jgi:hypothetical protein